MRVAINGCGIAGPALAYWLVRSGHEPVLIERARQLRQGGYIVDFWGSGYDIAEQMGLIPQIRKQGYQVREVRFVDQAGRRKSGFSADVFRRMTHGRFASLRRSDLAAALYGAVENDVETIFGDSIAAIDDDGEDLRVTFEKTEARHFDLAIGADGLHSRVRHIAFGPEGESEVPLGLHVAAFEAQDYRRRDELTYVSFTKPGRQISRFAMRGDRTLFLFVFRDEHLQGGRDCSDSDRKRIIRAVFGSDGWESSEILAELDRAQEIYYDRVSQIHLERWTKGRVALVGDAAAAVSLLAGEGAGLGIVEAYVLAGELARLDGDYVSAFSAYEQRLMPMLRQKQFSARRFASAFAPRSAIGIAVRNVVVSLLNIPPLAHVLVGRDLRDEVELPDYAWR